MQKTKERFHSAQCFALPDIYKTIKILVLDTPDAVSREYSDIRNYPLYDITFTCSIKSALNELNLRKYHVCLFDIKIKDVGDDDFILSKKYAKRIPFIFYTSCTLIDKGFEAHQCGIKQLIMKNSSNCSQNLINTINYYFLKTIATPQDTECINSTIRNCVDTLLEKEPETITQWAQYSGITEVYLRKLWKDCFNIQPKFIISLFSLYNRAIKCLHNSSIDQSLYERLNYIKSHKHVYDCFYF